MGENGIGNKDEWEQEGGTGKRGSQIWPTMGSNAKYDQVLRGGSQDYAKKKDAD